MTVKLVYRGKEYEVQEGMTVRDAIKKVGLQPETVLAVHGGKLLTDDTLLKSEMKTIKLVAVISGGRGVQLPAPGPQAQVNAPPARACRDGGQP
jgi:sulfur carrier protein ThiS